MSSQTFIDLSRWQFATTAAFHMTFPALSVGLAIFVAVLYGAYYKTGNPLYLQMFRFWRSIFAIGRAEAATTPAHRHERRQAALADARNWHTTADPSEEVIPLESLPRS